MPSSPHPVPPAPISADELLSANVKEKRDKIRFLEKLVAFLEGRLGGPGTTPSARLARPGKVVAGLEPERTRYLLQVFAVVAEAAAAEEARPGGTPAADAAGSEEEAATAPAARGEEKEKENVSPNEKGGTEERRASSSPGTPEERDAAVPEEAPTAAAPVSRTALAAARCFAARPSAILDRSGDDPAGSAGPSPAAATARDDGPPREVEVRGAASEEDATTVPSAERQSPAELKGRDDVTGSVGLDAAAPTRYEGDPAASCDGGVRAEAESPRDGATGAVASSAAPMQDGAPAVDTFESSFGVHGDAGEIAQRAAPRLPTPECHASALADAVRGVARATDPLGAYARGVREDLAAARREAERWRAEARPPRGRDDDAREARERRRAARLGPLRARLDAAEGRLRDRAAAIRELEARVERNDRLLKT